MKISPLNPNVQRMGRVERRFQDLAAKLRMRPGPLLEQMIREGITQDVLAGKLQCTRQAIGILAKRYGLQFPGAWVDIEAQARRRGFKNLEAYLHDAMVERRVTQEQMASELGVSSSTLKRRILQVLDN